MQSKLIELLKQYAIVRKDVILASGQQSNIYIDCRQMYFRGEAQQVLGELLYKKMIELEGSRGLFSACGGMAMGSIPLTIALSSEAFRRDRNLPGCAVRKESKEHGIKAQIEGMSCLFPEARVLIVEDVVTTAMSAIKAIEVLRNAGCHVDSLICIVDRQQGGQKNLADIGVNMYALLALKDLENTCVDTHDRAL